MVNFHGDSKRGKYHYLYDLHKRIISRCNNPKFPNYSNYGGRGIKIAEEWMNNYSLFKSDILSYLSDRPTPQHSLDRIDNDGDYVIENLRWATSKEQSYNRRCTLPDEDILEIRWLLLLGYTLREIAKDYNTSSATIHDISWNKTYNHVNL